jgi:large subunit ribosomal protein L35
VPKMKTHSGAKKRFKITANGKVKTARPNKNHILAKMKPKRKRHLTKDGYVGPELEHHVKRLLVVGG